jgi:hypothetical protein
MKRFLMLAVAVVSLAAGARAFAHHSFAATYLEDQSVTIEGQLVQFLLRNPHSFVHVMVKEPDGTTARYVVEWGSPSQLAGRESRPQPGRPPRATPHLQASEGRLELGDFGGRNLQLEERFWSLVLGVDQGPETRDQGPPDQ